MPTVHANDNITTNLITVNNINNNTSTTQSSTTISANNATLTTTATATTNNNHNFNINDHHNHLHLSTSTSTTSSPPPSSYHHQLLQQKLDLNGNNDTEQILLDELLESLNYETILMNETLAKAKLSALNNNPIYDVAKDHEMTDAIAEYRRYRCSDSLSNSSSNNSPPSNAIQRRLISESDNSSSISPSLSERSNVIWSDQVRGSINQSNITKHISQTYIFMRLPLHDS